MYKSKFNDVIKTILVLIALTVSLSAQAQQGIHLSLMQDAKLAVIGDDKGNEAFTPNFRLKAEMQNNKGVFIYPEFEYADLKKKYMRFSLNIGYRFKLYKEIFSLSASAGYGLIDREGQSYSSIAGDASIDLKFSKSLYLTLNTQLAERKDIDKLVLSNFIGFRYHLLKL